VEDGWQVGRISAELAADFAGGNLEDPRQRGGEANTLRSLTTEYPANGSFSDHTHAVCMKTDAGQVLAREVGRRQFEFLMVKLLRVYGECLGIKSRRRTR
jgi:hypothetical protein